MGQEYDSPWKEALERFFPHFLQLFFKSVFVQIDWSRGYEVCNSELAKLAPDSAQGHREADMLVGVTRLDDEPVWVLVHVEIQNQEDPRFAERMLVYHYRIFDRFRAPLCSLAVLGDTNLRWRPNCYWADIWDTRFGVEFPIVKLEDYRHDIRNLETSPNPSGPIVAAHLHTRSTEPDEDERRRVKFRMLRQLLESGHDPEDIQQLLRLLDWLLQLSSSQEEKFRLQIEKYRKETGMSFISTFERMGLEKGMAEGHQRGLEKGMAQGLEQGLAEGHQKGLEKGIAEGHQKGLEKGIAEGHQKGLADGLRSSILLVLEERFGETGEFASRLTNLEPQRLHSLVAAAARASSLEEFGEAIRAADS